MGAAPDLTITIAGSTDTLTIKDQFFGDKIDLFGFFPITWESRVEKFKFADGTTLTWEDVLHTITTGTAGADNLYGAYYADTLDGKAGNDYLSGNDDGDTYLFGLGYGQDVIQDGQINILTNTGDTLKFGAGITVANTIFSRDAANPLDLKVSISGTSDTVTMKGEFDYLETGVFGTMFFDRIEYFQWADGTFKNINTIVQDLLLAGKTAGADSLFGTYDSNTLDGGAGNDYLDGGAGSDTYIMARGYGNDLIHETNGAHFTNDSDIVQFGTGILPTDIALTRYGTNNLGLTATINAGGGSISIDEQFKFWIIGPNRAEIEQFTFTNGTVWNTNDIRLTYLQQAKTAGNDTITGFFTNDIIDGGAGNDLLDGVNGSDTYFVGIGSGHDRITETTLEYTENRDVDTLQFGTGVTLAQVQFTRVGNDLKLAWNGINDDVTVTGQFEANGTGGTSWSDIELITFTDGTKLTAVDTANKVLAAQCTSGADTLAGSFYAERLDGGAGNDILRGGSGGDTYVFKLGMGQDTIQEDIPDTYLDQPDTLEFGAGIARTAVSFTRVGNDLVASIASGEKATIVNQFVSPDFKVELFKFADGSTVTYAQAELGATLAQSTSGDDTILGTTGDDVLDGGAGNDLIKGGYGNDTYVFGRGSGQDTINDNDLYPYSTSASDKVSFLPGIRPSDVILTRSGDDLIITISGATDQLTIIGQFTMTAANADDRIESFNFADGTRWSAVDIDKALIAKTTTSGADTTVGYDSDDTFLASAGNDLLKGGFGNDTYRFERGSGQDTIDDNVLYQNFQTVWADKVEFGENIEAADLILTRAGNDLIIGISGTSDSLTIQNQFLTTKQTIDAIDRIENFVFANGMAWTAAEVDAKVLQTDTTAGNDTTVGYDSDDTIAISAGNDLLKGGYGNDTYLFGRGAGQDTIDDNDLYPYQTSWSDTVKFAPDLRQEDLTFQRLGNDLIISIAGTTDKLTITNQFQTTLQSTDNLDRIENFTLGNGLTLSAKDIDQIVLGQAQTAGNDTIVGYDSGDTLDGGAGNDLLKGGYGNDTFVFGVGYGQDTIDDNDLYPYQTSLADRVSFKTGIAQGDLRYARSADDIVMTIAGTTDTLTIKNQFSDVLSSANHYDRIESFTFADGSSLTASEIDLQVLTALSTSGNDTIVGYNTDDKLDGGLGNDTLKGGYGNDTYVFGRGYGQDTIDDNDIYPYQTSLTDRVVFIPGIALSDLNLSRSGDDLIIQIAGTTDQITIKNQLGDVLSSANNYDRIENFVFGDGSIVSATTLDALLLARAGTPGADTIIGYNSNDILQGKGGADTLDGRDGSDTYVYTSGDGNDVIGESSAGNYDSDRLKFTNLNATDVTLSKVGLNLVVRVTATTETITVNQHFFATDKYGIEVIEFANGTTWDLARINTAANGTAATFGTIASETLNGTTGIDTIFGEGGNDTINGNAANDAIGGGDGNDIVDGGLGSDTLYGDSGNDTFNESLSAPSDFDIIFGGDGSNTISFGGFGSAVNVDLQGVYDVWTSDTTTYALFAARPMAQVFDVENVVGSGFFDFLSGDDQTNIFTGGAGNDILNGRLGTDTAVYSGTFSQYVIGTAFGVDFTITDTVGGRDGIDSLTGIEKLQFSDRTLGLAPATVAIPIADRAYSKNAALSFALPTGTFADKDNDPLTLSAKLADGSILPSWLAFNATTGTLSGTPPLNYFGAIDVRVTAFDGYNNTFDDFKLTILDVNHTPTITSNGGGTTATTAVAEMMAAVTTVVAADTDPDTLLTYAISGGADAAKFKIDAATGALSFLAAPNFEAPSDVGANNVYDVTVQVNDGTLTATQAIAVTVTNVNETPTITSNGGGATAAITLAENIAAVTTVTGSDPDAGTTLSYTIAGGPDAAKFTINMSTGALAFVAAPNFEAPTDVGANNVYDVIVQVSDGSLTKTQSVAVTVTNVNEAPTITSNGGAASAAISVAENTTAVTTVTATDPDAGATLAYSISGGADAAKFAINATTGALSFVAAPNFEAPTDVGTNNVYDVVVQVSDGTLTKTQAIAVTVTNVNETPTIISNGGGASAAISIAENSTGVATVVGSDPDAGTTLTYSISGGPEAAKFAINAATGALVFVSGPNFEAPSDVGANNVYDVIVQVSDGSLTKTQSVAVAVTNVNEAPSITSNGGAATAAVLIAENTTAVTTVIATDPDTGATLTYSISGGADAAKFAINASTGVLSFVTGRDFENPTDVGANNVYDVTVQVSDGALIKTQAIAVTIADVNPEIVSGTTGDDVMFGGALNDQLSGIAGNDTLNGGGGVDTLIGGTGNDIYVVDTTTDIITELLNEGADTIQSSVTYSLVDTDGAGANGGNVENLTLTGTAIIDGTGNALANTITGNTAANKLDGGAGVDTLVGGQGNDIYVVDLTTDIITELVGEGTDTIQSSVTYSLVDTDGAGANGGNVENLTLTGTGVISGTGNALVNVLIGNTANNALTGAAGNDTLDGGAGTVTLVGGIGNDTYVVDSTTDVITELTGEGTDTVQSSVTYSLVDTDGAGANGGNVENLTLTGSGAINGMGNTLANTIIGNSGANVLNGWLANDVLTGGLGADIFVFNTTLGAANIDSITDFSVVDDTFNLENTGTGLFTVFAATGAIAASAFWTGTAAHLATDRIIYNSVTGDVLYDADGTGATAAVKFASVTTGLALTNLDFVVI